MSKDLISIVVPVYNVEKYLNRCVDSILNQSYSNFELILIDDGSPDNCPDICDKYAENNQNIKVIHKKNGGLSSARNEGLKISLGKYICFIDSDDYVDKEYIEKLYESLINNNSDISICNYYRVYKTKISKCIADRFKTEYFITPAAWNKMYKRELFTDIMFPEGKYYEDLGTIPKLIMKSKNISYVDEYLYYYVQNDNSIMKKTNDKIFDIYDVFDSLIYYSKSNYIYDIYKEKLELAAIFHILMGTCYRAKNHKDFSLKMVKNIESKVLYYFSNWKKNTNIKNLDISYRLFLIFYKIKFYFAIYLGLKIFGKYIKEYK